MNDDELSRAAEEAADEVGLIDAGLALATAILHELEKRFPGFDGAVFEEMNAHADRLEHRGEHGDSQRATSIRELVDWLSST